MVYGNVQRVVAVQVKGGDGMEDFGAADAVLPCQYPLVGDDFSVDGVMVEGLQLLPVPAVDYLSFHEHTYAAVGVSLCGTYAEV